MKNQNLYTHLFNLRQVIHALMGHNSCWSLHYAVKNNMISHLNGFMDQLLDQDFLNAIDLFFECETVIQNPSLKEVVDIQNQVLSVYQLIKDLEVLDPNFSVVANLFESLSNQVNKFK